MDKLKQLGMPIQSFGVAVLRSLQQELPNYLESLDNAYDIQEAVNSCIETKIKLLENTIERLDGNDNCYSRSEVEGIISEMASIRNESLAETVMEVRKEEVNLFLAWIREIEGDRECKGKECQVLKDSLVNRRNEIFEYLRKGGK